MRFLAVVVLVTALATAGTACAPAPAGAGGSSDWPAGRTFTSSSLTGHTLVAGTRISLAFHRDGTLSANADCNTMSGSGSVSGGRLIISQLVQTSIGCASDRMNQDQWLTSFLTAKPRWHLADGKVQLTGHAVRMTLTT